MTEQPQLPLDAPPPPAPARVAPTRVWVAALDFSLDAATAAADAAPGAATETVMPVLLIVPEALTPLNAVAPVPTNSPR